MYHKPKVSVIIPCYNSEKFLKKAVDSVRKQSLEEIEIILIDDGSTDKTSTLLQSYKMEDNRIEIISHSKNQGLGAARNNGISNANGEYLFFLDSDDYIHPNFLESLYDKAQTENTDILQAQILIHHNDTKEIYPKDLIPFKQPVNGIEYYNEGIFIEPKACGKLWKTAFIKDNNLQFSNTYYEDIFMVFQAFVLAKRINNILLPGYHYIINKNSITGRKITSKHVVDYQTALINLQNLFKHDDITGKTSSFPASYGLYLVKLCQMAQDIDDVELFASIKDFVKKMINLYGKHIHINRNLPYLKRKLMVSQPCLYGKLKRKKA